MSEHRGAVGRTSVRGLLGVLGLIALAAGLALWLWPSPGETVKVPPPASQPDPATLERGAYLATLGHCAGCHTTPGGAPYAGGRGLLTPFGTVYAGNLTPDRATGLGLWTAEDFWQALHHGRSRDGRRLNPAFPYAQYTRIRREDVDALYAYLQSLPAVEQATPAASLRFPVNLPGAVAVWQALYFQPGEYQPDATRSADWNRGAYLVQGLGHCAACHGTRNALGGLSDALTLGGQTMPDGKWHAPALGPRASNAAPYFERYLQHGGTDIGYALGPMASVVFGSTQHWKAEDLRATATYLQSLPPVPAPPPARTTPDPTSMARGAKLYDDQCAACHGEQGQGVVGVYPRLAGSHRIQTAELHNLVGIIVRGGFPAATHHNPRPYGMPPLGLAFNDQDVADLVTYVRNSWGHAGGTVTPLDVLQVRR